MRRILSQRRAMLRFRWRLSPSIPHMKLQLAAQDLKQLPDAGEDAREVTEIDASFNKLRSLPRTLLAFRNLRTLRLGHILTQARICTPTAWSKWRRDITERIAEPDDPKA